MYIFLVRANEWHEIDDYTTRSENRSILKKVWAETEALEEESETVEVG